MSYGAVSQVSHAVSQHQNKLFERNESLVKTDNLNSHTPIALSILYSTRMFVLNYYVPHIALHHREQLLTHILH